MPSTAKISAAIPCTSFKGTRFAMRSPKYTAGTFASMGGKQVAAVAIMEGIPGRNGEVTRMSAQAETTFTPAPGAHFYYAKVTQDDGNMLWSAPVWVTQAALAY